MVYRRDPLSELFDRGARQLLARAYAKPGQWAGTALADPSPRHIAHFAGQGIDVLGPASRSHWQTRWAEGFKRSLYWHHDHFYRSQAGGLDMSERRTTVCRNPVLIVEVGRQTLRGRAVRIRIMPGGAAAVRAAKQLPESKRFVSGDLGTVNVEPGPAAGDPSQRDWQPELAV